MYALEPGTTVVTAKATNSEGDLKTSNAVDVTVTNFPLEAIYISGDGVIDLGETKQYTAGGIFEDGTVDYTDQVTWFSSDDGIATVSNLEGTKGQVTGRNIGSTVITIIDPASGEQDVLEIVVSQ